MSEEEPVEIPASRLDPETLQALLEAYVMREGTDYGEREFSLSDKVAQLREALARKEAVIVYDLATESFSLIPRQRL